MLKKCPVKANEQRKHGPSTLLQNTSVCQYCHQWLHPNNYRMRLRPKRRPSARVQSVLRRKARGKRLSLMQKDLLQRFQKSSSVLGHFPPTSESTDRRESVKSPSGNTKSSAEGLEASTLGSE
ncbi:hypothetical protein NQZ68_001754 [Dissostichus eleginoides]|nr:hypothetical protein NQZ68_001754 [Dissostichus eleginoides]